jgi:hypothetical protein
MLIAGCMDPADASYDSIAEVHVPAYCTDQAKVYKKGCLLPWAKNFDPMAKQSGKCLFEVKGCTDSDSVNYNSEASMEDPDKPCIKKVLGCTVNNATYTSMAYGSTYKSVDAATPEYKSGKFGSNKRLEAGSPDYWPGEVHELGYVTPGIYPGVTVTSYDPAANVLQPGGCTVAIEGCMDAEAANYDSKATVNSHTWCIPEVFGCMMPATQVATPTKFVRSSGSGDGVTYGDGLNPYWSASISVHVPSMCVTARYGCMEEGAVNYDWLANIQTRCWFLTYGCLDPQAVNYGCRNNEFKTKCTSEPGYLPDQNVTVHQERACLYPWNFAPEPPAPPSPNIPANIDLDSALVVVTQVVGMLLEVGGEVSDFGPRKTCEVAQALQVIENDGIGCCCNDVVADTVGTKSHVANGFGSDCGENPGFEEGASMPWCFGIDATAGSVNLNSQKVYSGDGSAAAAAAASAGISNALGGNTDSAQAILGDAAGIQILRMPVITVTEEITIKEVNYFNATAASVTVTLGMIFCIAMIALYYYLKKGRGAKKPVYPA